MWVNANTGKVNHLYFNFLICNENLRTDDPQGTTFGSNVPHVFAWDNFRNIIWWWEQILLPPTASRRHQNRLLKLFCGGLFYWLCLIHWTVDIKKTDAESKESSILFCAVGNWWDHLYSFQPSKRKVTTTCTHMQDPGLLDYSKITFAGLFGQETLKLRGFSSTRFC